MQKYHGQAGIFEVSFNADGTKVAACFSNNTVSVIDGMNCIVQAGLGAWQFVAAE